MKRQKNKTISFVLMIIAAASITGLVAPSLGTDVQAERDGDEYKSNYNDDKQKSYYNDDKQKSYYNDNVASNEYAKYFDPKDKNVKVEVIKCDNSITNILDTNQEQSQIQVPVNVGIGGLGATGAEEGATAAGQQDENKLAQLSIDKNTVVWCKSENNYEANVDLIQRQTQESNQDIGVDSDLQTDSIDVQSKKHDNKYDSKYRDNYERDGYSKYYDRED
ncbi:MAG: hypothetical protein ACM31H_05030 [Nitrososphaerales archaeon]